MNGLYKNKFDSSRFFELACLHLGLPNTKSTSVVSKQPMKSQDIFVCPMHPEVRKNDPSVCPKCGMRLELIPPSLESGENPDRLDEKINDQNISRSPC